MDQFAKLLHITNNFVMVQNCFSCEAKLLHLIFFAPQTMSAESATIIMYAYKVLFLKVLTGFFLDSQQLT